MFILGALPIFTGCALSEGRVFAECPAKQKSSEARAQLANRLPSVTAIAEQASSPDAQAKMQGTLDNYLYRWFYGQGLGETTLNVGTVVVFPPYVIYLLANAGLSLSGYDPISPLSYVPGAPGDYARASYDAITSVPGRATSTVADEPFQGEDPCIP